VLERSVILRVKESSRGEVAPVGGDARVLSTTRPGVFADHDPALARRSSWSLVAFDSAGIANMAVVVLFRGVGENTRQDVDDSLRHTYPPAARESD
jgi:hypothetical protein